MEWLNYHHLYYFWTVVRAGGVTKASKELRLAPPTVSAQLRQLEDSLGEKLMTRAGRNVVPTETGRMVFAYANDIFTLGRELMDAIHNRGPQRTARIVIGIDDVLPKEIAHRLIEPALALERPVRIVCREASFERLIADLAVHELDVVLSDAPIGPTASVRAYNHLLGECGTIFMATEAAAKRYRRHFPKSLDRAPMLLPTDDTAIRRSLDQWFDSLGVRPDVIGEFEDYALIREFARGGTGIFPAPSVLEENLRSLYGLCRVGTTKVVRGRFYAISPERKLRQPAVLAICETARHKFFGAISAK